jgi:protein lifeguard
MSQQYNYQYKATGEPTAPPPVGFTAPPMYTQQAYPQQGFPQQGYPAYSGQNPYPQPPPQQYATDFSGGQSYNVNNMPNNDATNQWAGFSDKNIRRLFVQKVYSILTLQLLVTFGIIALFVFTPSIKRWGQQNLWAYFLAYIIFFVIYLTLMCCQGPRRNYPTNFILLSIFTLALSFMAAMICVHHDVISVLIAAGITAVCCGAVSVLSFYTKFDFTKYGWALAIAAFALMIAGFLMIFIKIKILYIVYAGAGTIIFMLFLAYDTQLITGGKKYEISPEEYILGSILLYVDIVYIFLFILQLVSAAKD